MAALNRDKAYRVLSRKPLVIQTAPGASLDCSYRNRTTVWAQGLNLGEANVTISLFPDDHLSKSTGPATQWL
jgi:hypothetical protein